MTDKLTYTIVTGATVLLVCTSTWVDDDPEDWEDQRKHWTVTGAFDKEETAVSYVTENRSGFKRVGQFVTDGRTLYKLQHIASHITVTKEEQQKHDGIMRKKWYKNSEKFDTKIAKRRQQIIDGEIT